MALQLTFTDQDVGLACPSVQCAICGGVPPYTVEVDHPGAKIVPLNQFLFRVDPPTNPGVGAGSAYSVGWIYGKDCSFGKCGCECTCKRFNCTEADNGDCINASELTCTNSQGKHHVYLCHKLDGGGNNCTQAGCVCDGPCPNCLEGTPSTTCPPVPTPLWSAGDLLDLRTTAMIEGGCRPCPPEMDGRIVTVTDSLGTSVSRVLKGFSA